jgi:hypothetical protein
LNFGEVESDRLEVQVCGGRLSLVGEDGSGGGAGSRSVLMERFEVGVAGKVTEQEVDLAMTLD